MFWKFNVLTSHIDTLLDKEDVTLREVLDEDDVLQECKGQNQKLVQFLIRPEHIEDLVNMVIQPPEDDMDEKNKYKYPNIACEVLTSEVPQITEHLANEEPLLNKIYSFLEREGPLNSLQASFFSKVMGLLIARKSQVMLEFLQRKEDFVGLLLQHLDTSAIMDMLLRLVTCMQSTECRQLCVQWLNEQKIVQKLIALIHPSQPEEKHSNAALALCDMVALSREHMSDMQERAEPDPLLASIESEENLRDLLCHMLDGEKVESVLVNGLLVIQTLLEFRKIGPEGCHEQMTTLDAERLAQGVRNTLHAVIPRLKDLQNTLIQPAKQHYNPMSTTAGHLDPPLGNARLQLVRLLASLLLTNTPALNTALAQLGTLNTILDLFFKYVWNNFLHTQVESCITTVLSNPPHEVEGEEEEEGKLSYPLLTQLFTDCKILQRILDVWENNELQEKRPGGRRRGYMGHLTKIANTINEHKEKGPNAEKIKEIFQEIIERTDTDEDVREKWESFISGTLADTNKTNTVDLVGSHLQSSSEDDDADFRDIPFPQDTAMQQAYSDYQTQPMTSSFIDQFGYKEDEFTEQEDRVDQPFSERISSINFDITVEDSTNAASLFEQACNERMQQFDDLEEEDELWETKELTFVKNTPNSTASTLPKSTGASGGRKSRRPLGHSDSDSDEVTLSDEEDNDSDSEEDLDSPRRVYQSRSVDIPSSEGHSPSAAAGAADSEASEKMEVDQAAAPEGLEEAMDDSSQGPTAMDTMDQAPWEGSEDSGEKPGEDKGWAHFTDISAAGAAAAAEVEQKKDEDNHAKMDSSNSHTEAGVIPPTSSEEMFGMELEHTSPDSSVDSSAQDISSTTAEAKVEVEAEAAAEKPVEKPAAAEVTSSSEEPPSQPRAAWGEDSQQPTSPPAQTPNQEPQGDTGEQIKDQHAKQTSDDQKEESPEKKPDSSSELAAAAGNVPNDLSQQLQDCEEEEEGESDLADNFKMEAKEAMEEFTSSTTPTSTNTTTSPDTTTNTENGPI